LVSGTIAFEESKMKAQVGWIAVVALAISLSATAQSSAGASEAGSSSAQAGQASASATQATSVSAELAKKIDSKDARVGDEVAAKTTAEARLADGTKLPKGSKLVGHVTDVQAKSHDNRDSHIAFALDNAVLKDGHEVPVQAMMRSISVPAPMASSNGSDDMMAGGGMQGGGPRAGGGGSGLSSSAPGTAHNATGPSGPTSVAAAGGLNNATSGLDGTVNGAAGNATALNAAAGLNGGQGVAAGPVTPVGNLAGVTFATIGLAAGASNGGVNGAAGTSTATMLTGHGKNVTLDSGAQMTLSVAPR
jgi:hypothetical protein